MLNMIKYMSTNEKRVSNEVDILTMSNALMGQQCVKRSIFSFTNDILCKFQTCLVLLILFFANSELFTLEFSHLNVSQWHTILYL